MQFFTIEKKRASISIKELETQDIDQKARITSQKQENSKKSTRLFRLPRRWVAAVCFSIITIIIILCSVILTLPHRKTVAAVVPQLTIPFHRDTKVCKQALNTNFADPSIFKVNNTWWAFGTNNAAGILRGENSLLPADMGTSNVQFATSTDFMNWTLHGKTDDPLPRLGDWVAKGTTRLNGNKIDVPASNLWAPDILQRPDGKYVLYYSATAANKTDSHCVGAAVSSNPVGPFSPLQTPLTCPTDLGGAIDPSPIIDKDGTIYVAYKVDGNNRGNGGSCKNTVPPLKATPIRLQKMQQDGTTPNGSPITIMDRSDADKDGPLVEAPALVRTDEGVYFLFFSTGCTSMPSYDVKYATSKSITGPYQRATSELLKTGDMGLNAPGSVSVRKDGNKWRMAFHARVQLPMGNVRAMFIANIKLNGTNASFDTFA